VRSFSYLFNGAFDKNKLLDGVFAEAVTEYVRRVIEELEVSYVTVAVPELVEIINKYYPQVSVKISTIYNVLTVEDLKKLEGLKINRVTLGNDAPRRPKELQEMLRYCRGKGYDLELLITETCLYQCKTRYEHYHTQTEDTSHLSTDWYMNNCILTRILNPEEFLKACWIRPEDIAYYRNLGITNFKISGRSKSPQWTKRCLSAYIKGSYDGNVMELFGTTPPKFEDNSEHLFSIDNKALQLYFDNHPMNCDERSCKECGYCKESVVRLFKSGGLTLNKICGDYEIAEDRLCCKPGPYTRKLMKLVEDKERDSPQDAEGVKSQ